MKKTLLLAGFVVLFASCGSGNKTGFREAAAPVAMKKEHIREIHGDRANDPYYWMYDYFGQGPDSSNVIAYLEAENAYRDTVMSGTKELQQKLYNEMRGRIKEADESVPTFRNGYYYYTRTEEGKQYFKYFRRKGSMDAPEELLFDVDEMAEGYNYYGFGGASTSPDNRMAAYFVDTVSRRQYTVYFKNFETGELTGEIISNTTGGVVWANDNKTVFYSTQNETTLLPEKIWRHELGTPQASDHLVYEEKDNTNFIGLYRSKNRKYIFLYSQSTTSTEISYISADDPKAEFKVFQPRMADVIYDVTPLEDRFLINTNKDAINFQIMSCPLDKTGVENWTEYIPHREDVLLDFVDEFKDYIAIGEMQEGLLKIRLRNLKDGGEHYIDFGEPAYSAYASSNPEYDSHLFRYGYSSMTTPRSTYDYDMVTHEKTLLKQTEVLGGFNPGDYKTERIYATADDGSRIPISLVYKKTTKLDGTAPLYLYAYGSYGSGMAAGFSTDRLSLLNRGFVYAITHIRGGDEMGRQWYEDGKLQNKMNTFTDYIDCAEHLIAEKYTSAGHIYAYGASAGGLLMGVVANLRPELWRGVIADVPFVDVVNTMLDESIPLTTNEYDEWGNPNNEADYWYMKGYSPYENVEAKDYPNILVITGLHDSQVQYFEPAKWVAKLRDMKTDDNLILLSTNMDAGHGGASGRFDSLKEVALEYAFIFTLEGIDK